MPWRRRKSSGRFRINDTVALALIIISILGAVLFVQSLQTFEPAVGRD